MLTNYFVVLNYISHLYPPNMKAVADIVNVCTIGTICFYPYPSSLHLAFYFQLSSFSPYIYSVATALSTNTGM